MKKGHHFPITEIELGDLYVREGEKQVVVVVSPRPIPVGNPAERIILPVGKISLISSSTM